MNGSGHPSDKDLLGTRDQSRNQPLVARDDSLKPSSSNVRPVGSRRNSSNPKNNSGSSDFIPLCSSGPNDCPNWTEFMNNASGSSSYTPWKNPYVSKPSHNSYSNSTPSRANSSFNYNPYKRTRNSTRGQQNFNRSNLKSCHISEYVSQSMFENPGAELKKQLKELEELEKNKAIGDSEEESQNSAVVESDSKDTN